MGQTISKAIPRLPVPQLIVEKNPQCPIALAHVKVAIE